MEEPEDKITVKYTIKYTEVLSEPVAGTAAPEQVNKVTVKYTIVYKKVLEEPVQRPIGLEQENLVTERRIEPILKPWLRTASRGTERARDIEADKANTDAKAEPFTFMCTPKRNPPYGFGKKQYGLVLVCSFVDHKPLHHTDRRTTCI